MCFSKEISKPLGLLTNEDEAIVTERGGGREERATSKPLYHHSLL